MYKSEIIPNKNIIIYLATGVLIGLIKFPYIFLLLMLFLIPAHKFKTKKIAIISEDLKMAKRKKLELIILFLIIYTSIFFIQYLSWTPVGYDGILGVGARYFIPILAILPLVFGHKSNSEKLTKYFIVFTTIFLSGMLLIIIAGFY